jgi:hypothetical protein
LLVPTLAGTVASQLPSLPSGAFVPEVEVGASVGTLERLVARTQRREWLPLARSAPDPRIGHGFTVIVDAGDPD